MHYFISMTIFYVYEGVASSSITLYMLKQIQKGLKKITQCHSVYMAHFENKNHIYSIMEREAIFLMTKTLTEQNARSFVLSDNEIKITTLVYNSSSPTFFTLQIGL